VLNMAVPGNGL